MTEKLGFIGIQTLLTKDRDRNLKEALKITDEALASYRKTDMVVLPEYFYWGPDHPADTPNIGPYPKEILEEFAARAQMYHTYILVGGVVHRREDGEVYNTSVLLDRRGEIAGHYDKVHLFDALNAMGGEKESDQVKAGDKLFTYEADFGKIGVSICYDIRFPEVARTYALQGVKYLFTPAAFYSPRADHWQNLLAATALHNSMYVTGVNLYGELNPDNIFCGRTLIADPWGIQVAVASDRTGSIQAYVDPEYVDEIRAAVGTIYGRRPDVYEIK